MTVATVATARRARREATTKIGLRAVIATIVRRVHR
jgi:hypothetical protein